MEIFTVPPQKTRKIKGLLIENHLPVDGFPDDLAVILCAVVDNETVGAAGMEIHGQYALLRSVVVDAAYRGKGAGKTLIHAAIQEARARGLLGMYLLTETAEGFFADLGFAALSRDAVPETVRGSVEFVSACPDTAVAMELRLVP